MGGTWDATNVVDAPGRRRHARSAWTTRRYLGDTLEEIAGEKAGIIKAGAVGVLAQQPLEAAEVLLRRGRRGRGDRRPRGDGVRRRLPRPSRSAARCSTCAGLGGEYDEVFLPLLGAHQAHNAAVALAAVEAFLGGGTAEPLDVDAGPRRASRGDLARPARGRTPGADRRCSTRRTTRPARAALADRGRRGLRLRPAGRRRRDARRQGRRGRARGLEPVLAEVVVTRTSSPARDGPPTSWPRSRSRSSAPTGSQVAPRLADALDAAIALAEEDGRRLGGAGVLVTGSVVTVGEARTLLRTQPRPGG